MDLPSIENHGLIGNMRSAALVSSVGIVDFFCFPDFDSPTLFAALLHEAEAGEFSLKPLGSTFQTSQLYIPDTNVLMTRFLSNDAIVEITDLMPLRQEGGDHGILRTISVLQGRVEVAMRCMPAFDYARSSHVAEGGGKRVSFTPSASLCPKMLLLSTVELQIDGTSAIAEFSLQTGEQAAFFFGDASKPISPLPIEYWAAEQLAATCSFWRAWASRSSYQGRWREQVSRSALVLKLLTSEISGAVVAAPTFGLPEALGGTRNGDYRYVRLRDASFTLYALVRLGFVEESIHFTEWLKDRLTWDGTQGPLRVMYRIDGGPVPEEVILTHWKGYQDSFPVRIGNGATNQFQLDIYGELIDAIYLSSKYSDGISYEGWQQLKAGLHWLSAHWRDADDGIWEVRGGRRHFLHSRLMCWVAFDRAIRLGAKRSLPGPFEEMQSSRDAIATDIHDNFWDPEVGAFVQYQGGKEVDASALLLPLVRFINPMDPRWLSTLAVIERDLMVDAFVKRYRDMSPVDGLQGREGSFIACSFWMVEALARSHQLDKARLLLEKLMSQSNALGLYSEEWAGDGRQVGNFPQALSHLAFISAATYLDRRLASPNLGAWS